jgi:hypothetical protein
VPETESDEFESEETVDEAMPSHHV